MEEGESSPAESDSTDQGEAPRAGYETCTTMGNESGYGNSTWLSGKLCPLTARKTRGGIPGLDPSCMKFACFPVFMLLTSGCSPSDPNWGLLIGWL